MEWIVALICILLAARYGEQGLTGGLVVTAAIFAMVTGIFTHSPVLATIAAVALLAMAIAFLRAARDHCLNSSQAMTNIDQP